jgi:RNA polymerase sigma-70 factor (ECF subfamily)
MDPESSFVLIQRAKAGDSEALERLLARYRPRLRRWASGRLPQNARAITDTEDVVQDVMIRTFRNFQAFDNCGEWALQAYLRHAVMNRIRDELRRPDNRQREELPQDVMSRQLSPLEAAIGSETFSRYEAALKNLSDSEREGVIARLELGCSYQEIAGLLDKPTADAARMVVSRALAKVAQTMSSM